ncbi:4Fe-4S dicluster domain-containing protein [Dethiosulfatarculus sandiegensis]|uniref:Ferredoxin n=1 Tax=Dethiosulfatarculus sandiegensis TaxID=1429043 RepID=A0A0D2J6C4_9BACT|nr:4Fe-4S dicluster domain-containing protein [Dethiosulfatarculus sandiegensis]KIX13694.1 dimethyl sulfoxide reductase subunit B [Dethiosulfatarculus sandiegensis]
MQWVFTFDTYLCSGCMACVIACQDQNDLSPQMGSFRIVTKQEEGSHPKVSLSFVSVACQHCVEAPCVLACPVDALYKRSEDGLVLVNKDVCIGCRTCEDVCPYGAAHFDYQGRMAKCHFCVDRLAQGQEPACVRVCHTGALGFGPKEEMIDVGLEETTGLLSQALGSQNRLDPA